MPLINLVISDTMLNHVESFRRHTGLNNKSEALRKLILAGCAHYGNPLNEDAFLQQGRPVRETEKEKPKETITQPNQQFDEDYYKKLFSAPHWTNKTE